MNSNKLHTGGIYRRLVACVVFTLVFATFMDTAQVSGANSAGFSAPSASLPFGMTQDTPTEMRLYLPVIYQQYPHPTIFGVETTTAKPFDVDAMSQAGAYWVRYPAFSWAKIEPVRTAVPTYQWDTVNEEGLRQIGNKDLKIVATVKHTPSWAQKIPGATCGPVAQESLDEFAEFMHNLVKRYSVFPYNIKYWEIGNEVDVDPALVLPDSIFGCWGDQADTYYGGGYYAQMLKSIYPAIKAADPQAQVLLGGLIVICDPEHATAGEDCKPAKFLEGILAGGGGPYFDVVSFHAFAFYQYGHVFENLPTWGPRGGIVMGKINYIRDVMAKYGYDKPLILTEASLLCHESEPACNLVSDAFKEAQANYVAMLYTRTWDANLLGTIWFNLRGSWRSSSLYSSTAPKPAYFAYQFMTSELRGARLIRSLNQVYPGVAGFEFAVENKKIWVLWASDYTDHLIDLPANTTQVYDKYGSSLSRMAGQVVVNGTVYIELTP